MKRIDLENDKKIASGFKVPDGYFEEIDEKIMNSISENNTIKVVSLFQKKKFWFSAIAAVFVLSFSIILFLSNNKNNTINADDYFAYESNISTYEIAEKLSDNDITSLEESLDLYAVETTENIEEYLY
jgi:hypothetical protein